MVVGDHALGRVVTGVGDGARVLAYQIDASLLGWTVGIVSAADGRARLVGVAGQTRWTSTSGLMLDAWK